MGGLDEDAFVCSRPARIRRADGLPSSTGFFSHGVRHDCELYLRPCACVHTTHRISRHSARWCPPHRVAPHCTTFYASMHHIAHHPAPHHCVLYPTTPAPARFATTQPPLSQSALVDPHSTATVPPGPPPLANRHQFSMAGAAVALLLTLGACREVSFSTQLFRRT